MSVPKSKRRYTVAESHDLRWVEERCNDLIDAGWEPQGSPVIFFTGTHHDNGDPRYYYAQAMVLRKRGAK